MNVLLLSLMYPEDTLSEVTALSKTGLQNQINSYQRAVMAGLGESLEPGERLDVVNALPVGSFPNAYRGLFLPGGLRDGHIRQLGGLNLPWFKQKGRERSVEKAILRWARENGDNRTLLIYTLYMPYLKAVKRAKRKARGLKAAVIVTDLPNQWGIASGRRGVMKAIEYCRGAECLRLCEALDGFVLLTEPMKEVLPVQNKPCMVMEGLIAGREESLQTARATGRPAVLYTGTLNRELGVAELLEAFQAMPAYELWLCGKGDMEAEVKAAAAARPNIRYFGFVPQSEALRLQGEAAALINPRSPKGVFTRYSFPSKTLEYMRSGKPVLCYRLDGIPREYDDYLCYIASEGAEGIRTAVERTLQRSPEALAELGMAGRRFALEQKNPAVQCRRLAGWLRKLG